MDTVHVVEPGGRFLCWLLSTLPRPGTGWFGGFEGGSGHGRELPSGKPMRTLPQLNVCTACYDDSRREAALLAAMSQSLRVLYTRDVKKKRPRWQDGFCVVEPSGTAKLLDEGGTTLCSTRVPAGLLQADSDGTMHSPRKASAPCHASAQHPHSTIIHHQGLQAHMGTRPNFTTHTRRHCLL